MMRLIVDETINKTKGSICKQKEVQLKFYLGA